MTIDTTCQTQQSLETARRVLKIEQEAIKQLSARLDSRFLKACALIQRCQNRVVLIGVGKSGHIAHKIAATLASTGTPSFYVHPAEACHGDVGMITNSDVVLGISYSGQSSELLALLPQIKRLGCPLIVMTGALHSPLAAAADVVLDISVSQEACPLGLAPTASTTVTLALGDALSMALMELRAFTQEAFAKTHPAGRLGRRLLLCARDIMHSGKNLPVVESEMLVTDALIEISKKGLGMSAVLSKGKLVGIFTDGDLRRAVDAGFDLRITHVAQVMSAQPKTIDQDTLVMDAFKQMQAHQINALLVTDLKGSLVGAFNMLDIARAGVI